uniref:Ig-like domain-containing protein n=1 Tax=Pseudonaja textilis TaxID=8673 RepID=A0A670ZPI7_PSETE
GHILSCLGGSTGQSVNQTPGILTVTEGKPVSLNCFFEAQSDSINFPFWYIQHGSQSPELLLNEIDNKNQGFQAIHHKNSKKGTFNTKKQATQLKDSAVYFCAFRDTQ